MKDIINVMKIEKNNPKLKLKYGFNHRYHPGVIRAKSIVDSALSI